MANELLHVAGGLGLFLLGMVVMTEGLRGMAGEWLNHWLARATNSPLSGATTGTLMTAILQSSSATTVTAVGLVGAGLLTFAQALGVIFGANLGTTVTGWLVAWLGLKLEIGDLVMPLILLGALLRLFGRGRWPRVGMALAGFGLLFQGIAVLQGGMAGLEGTLTPTDLPGNDPIGRLQLVAIGIGVTLVTQSSSAGVATALTALHAGAIGFEQAAAVVIGMDVGTTVTAAVATLGGSVDTRRTGYSHVIYNLLTAALALLLLPLYTDLWRQFGAAAMQHDPELVLVGFHSLFNLLGVLAVLPFADRFAALMKRIVPAPQDPVIDRLDPHLLQNPTVALDVVARSLDVMIGQLFALLAALLRGESVHAESIRQAARRLDALHGFLDRIHLQPGPGGDWQRLNAAFHILDHLQRLHERCDEDVQRALKLARTAALAHPRDDLRQLLDQVLGHLAAHRTAAAVAATQEAVARMQVAADALRTAIMAEVAVGGLDVPEGTRRLEAVRWLRRVTHHVTRVCAHLEEMQGVSAAATAGQGGAAAVVSAGRAMRLHGRRGPVRWCGCSSPRDGGARTR